jgi:condensin complex subunit 1
MMNNEHLERLTMKQRNCLRCLESSIQVDLKFLWNKRSLDEEFYKYFAETCQKMMESRIILREQQAKQTIFRVLETVLAQQPEALRNIQIRLINLVYEDENIVEPIADFVIKAYKSGKENMIKLSTETLSLLVTFITEKTNVNNESQAVKNTKDFLCKVSDEMPKLFYNNLSTFISLFDSEV